MWIAQQEFGSDQQRILPPETRSRSERYSKRWLDGQVGHDAFYPSSIVTKHKAYLVVAEERIGGTKKKLRDI